MEPKHDTDAKPNTAVGATAHLPHDRITLQRFREAFPRARWSDRLNAWFVPGRTAQKRLGRWLAEQEAEADRFADEKGRDAFEFDPIQSRYLEAAPSAFHIRTPYARTIVGEIREIPYARWDADRRIWTVPYRSIEELRRRWPAIKAAAERSEPAPGRHAAKPGREARRKRSLRQRRGSAGASAIPSRPTSLRPCNGRSARIWASSCLPAPTARSPTLKPLMTSIFPSNAVANMCGCHGGPGRWRNW